MYVAVAYFWKSYESKSNPQTQRRKLLPWAQKSWQDLKCRDREHNACKIKRWIKGKKTTTTTTTITTRRQHFSLTGITKLFE